MLKLYSLSGGTTKDPRLQLFKKRTIGTKYRKPIKLIDASKIIATLAPSMHHRMPKAVLKFANDLSSMPELCKKN